MNQKLGSFFIIRNDLGHLSQIGAHFFRLETGQIESPSVGKIKPYQYYRYDDGHIILYLSALFCMFNSLKHDHYDHKKSR